MSASMASFRIRDSSLVASAAAPAFDLSFHLKDYLFRLGFPYAGNLCKPFGVPECTASMNLSTEIRKG
jgi:hypothetical protein